MRVTITNENGKSVKAELKLIKDTPKTGWERVKNNERYYSVPMISGKPNTYTDVTGETDNRLYTIANYFSTEEKAREINDIQTLFRQMKRFADEKNDKDAIRNHRDLYYMGYDELMQNVKIQRKYSWIAPTDKCISPFEVYFTSIEICEEAIDLFGDTYKRLLTNYIL